MEAKLFKRLCAVVDSIARVRRRRGDQFSDRIILLIYLWSVLHDRPVKWACDMENWHVEVPFNLPSNSTMSRRLRKVSFQLLMEQVLAAAADLFAVPLVKQIDSMPLRVGSYSRDVDAKRGRVAAGLKARGYRLHALTHGRSVQKIELTSMSEHDSCVAPKLLGHLRGGGYVAGDNAYDCNGIYQQADRNNHQLVAPARRVNKGKRDLKNNCPQRLRGLDLLDSPLEHCGTPGEFGRQLYNCRQPIESCFGGLNIKGPASSSGVDAWPTPRSALGRRESPGIPLRHGDKKRT